MTKQDEKNTIAIAGMQKDIGYIVKGVDSIDTKIDLLTSAKADKSALDEVKRDVKSLIAWRYWLTGASAAIGAIIALAVNFFRGIK